MSLLDNEITLLDNTDYTVIGFPNKEDIKEINGYFNIGKYYEWKNKVLFDQYKFVSLDIENTEYHLKSLASIVSKNTIKDAYFMRPGFFANYLYKSDTNETLIQKEFYLNSFISSKSESHLLKEAYKILTFFKEHIDCINTFEKIINYEYLNLHGESYVLSDNKGKLIVIPDVFKNALEFIEFISDCKLRDIQFYRQFEYITKFHIPWVC